MSNDQCGPCLVFAYSHRLSLARLPPALSHASRPPHVTMAFQDLSTTLLFHYSLLFVTKSPRSLAWHKMSFTMEFQCPFPDSSLPTPHSSPNQPPIILCWTTSLNRSSTFLPSCPCTCCSLLLECLSLSSPTANP